MYIMLVTFARKINFTHRVQGRAPTEVPETLTVCSNNCRSIQNVILATHFSAQGVFKLCLVSKPTSIKKND